MNKIIPILPCENIQVQSGFYRSLGFELVKIYTRPNAYSVVRYGEIEIHFFGNKKFIPSENPSMCILQVEDVDKVCAEFTAALKKVYGSVPRTGIPKITKVRDLSDDRRFTLTDTGGNTFYVITPNEKGASVVFRTLEDQEYAKDFATLYDLIYSKEDRKVAENMLSKLFFIKELLNDSDKAKFLLVELEILGITGKSDAKRQITDLLEKNKGKTDFWKDVEKRLDKLLQKD